MQWTSQLKYKNLKEALKIRKWGPTEKGRLTGEPHIDYCGSMRGVKQYITPSQGTFKLLGRSRTSRPNGAIRSGCQGSSLAVGEKELKCSEVNIHIGMVLLTKALPSMERRRSLAEYRLNLFLKTESAGGKTSNGPIEPSTSRGCQKTFWAMHG